MASRSRTPRAERVWRAQEDLKPGELPCYPWIETAATVRIPKGFLAYFEFDAVEYARGPGIPWAFVSDRFIQLYRLRDDEAKAVKRRGSRRDASRSKGVKALHLALVKTSSVREQPAPSGLGFGNR